MNNNTGFDFNALISDKPIDSSFARDQIFKLLGSLEVENDIEKRKELTQKLASLVVNEFGILTGVAYKYKGTAISLYDILKRNGILSEEQEKSSTALPSNAIR